MFVIDGGGEVRRSRVVLILFICLVLALPLAAQTTTGTITGTVLDAQGAVVPGASVTATNVAQNASTKATTDGMGKFTFVQMLPSTYTITIEAKGFKKFEQRNVVLTGNSSISVGSIALEIGAATEMVEVVAQGDQLQVETAQRGTTIVAQQVSNIQNNGRNFLGLLRIVPGMYTDLNTQTATNQTGNINMNGSRATQANITVNGASNVDTGSNTKMFVTINPDTIQEFTVLSNSYDAQYGKAGGAQINVVTKSGTTSFHGMGYDYFRDRSMNANTWSNKLNGALKPAEANTTYRNPAYHYNTAGYNIGGPIYIPGKFNKDKKKLFFFWSDEYQHQVFPSSPVNITVPTLLERKGDFSQSIDTRISKTAGSGKYIKDPLSLSPCNSGNTAGCFQDGGVVGVIPQDRWYGGANGPGFNLLNWLPEPNTVDPSGNNAYNFTSAFPQSNPRHEQMLRVDYNINDKWRLNGTFANLAKDVYTSYYCPSGYSLCGNVPVTPYIYDHPGHIISANLSTTINDRTTNEFIWDIGTHPVTILPQDPSKLTVEGTGIDYALLFTAPQTVPAYPGDKQWIPNINFGGQTISNSPRLNNGNGGSWTPYVGYNTTIEFADNFSRMQGKHFLRFGAFVQRSRKNQPAYNTPSGSYNFGATGNGNSPSTNPFDTYNGFANALIGSFQSFNQSTAYLMGRYRYTNAEFYVQDSWRVTQRLTLNFGVRAYYAQPQYDQGGNASNFLPSAFDPNQAQHIFMPSKDAGTNVLIDSVTKQIVWSPTMTNSSCPYPAATAYNICQGKFIPGIGSMSNGLLQAGQTPLNNPYLMTVPPLFFAPRFGLAFDVTGHGNLVLRAGGGAFPDRYQGNQIFNFIGNPPATYSPTIYNNNVYSLDPNSALGAPVNINGIDTKGRMPVVYNWNAGIQAKLPKGFTTDIAYVGSTSRHLINMDNVNGIPFGGAFELAAQDPTKGLSSIPGKASYSSTYIRPYQGFDNIYLQNFGGTSNYNALQAQVSRRFTSGLFVSASYVWSKCMDTADYDGNGLPVFPDPNMQRAYSYGPCGFDVRQNFTASYVYSLPKFSKMMSWANNGVGSRILDGWKISGVTIFRNGNPTTVMMNMQNNDSVVYFTGTGSQISQLRAVLVGDPHQGTSSSDPFNRLNPAAFAMQPLPTTAAGPNCPNFGCVTSFTYGFGQGRNQIITPGVNNFDLTLQKDITIKEGKELQLRLEAFNAFNHTQFSGLNTNIKFNDLTNPVQDDKNKVHKADGSFNSGGFGAVSGARDPRRVQISAKFVF